MEVFSKVTFSKGGIFPSYSFLEEVFSQVVKPATSQVIINISNFPQSNEIILFNSLLYEMISIIIKNKTFEQTNQVNLSKLTIQVVNCFREYI